MTKTKKAILIETDGYSITHTFYDGYKEAKEALDKRYIELLPEDLDEDWADMSYCGEYDAILYNNGEDVYVWKIVIIPSEAADV